MTAPIASGWSESPGGPCTHWKAPPFHGARRFRSFPRSSVQCLVPKPVIPASGNERQGCTLLGHSASHSERLFLPQKHTEGREDLVASDHHANCTICSRPARG